MIDNNVDLRDYMVTYPSELPCGMFYPNGSLLLVRPCSVKEILAYSVVDDTNYPDIVEKIDDILSSCVRIKYIDGSIGSYLDLKEQDKIFILFKIRELTFQQAMYLTVNKTCVCGNETAVELCRMNFIYFKIDEKITSFFDDYQKCFSITVKEKTFKLTMPSIGLQKSFNRYTVDILSQKKKLNMSFLKIMPYLLGNYIDISFSDIEKEILKYEEITLDEFQILNSAIIYMKFGINELRKWCDKCKSEIRTPFVFPTETQIFSLFKMPHSDVLSNIMQLQHENFVTNEMVIEKWPFWLLEEKIKIANKIIQDKEKNRKSEEDKQKQQMPNINPSSYTNGLSSVMSKFKK